MVPQNHAFQNGSVGGIEGKFTEEPGEALGEILLHKSREGRAGYLKHLILGGFGLYL